MTARRDPTQRRRSWIASGPSAHDVGADVELARSQAAELVRGVRESTGSRQLAVIDEVTSVGLQSQRNAGAAARAGQDPAGTFLDEGGASKEIATGMVDLRVALDRIDPDARAARPVGAHGRVRCRSCATTPWSGR